jgi:hypothetical protein
MRPELSRVSDEEDRDLDYEKRVQLKPHGLPAKHLAKVGVTRKPRLPHGGSIKVPMKSQGTLEAPNRYLAGITEVALKAVADKTNWRKC